MPLNAVTLAVEEFHTLCASGNNMPEGASSLADIASIQVMDVVPCTQQRLTVRARSCAR